METPFPVDLGRIAQDLQIRRIQVETVAQLLEEGLSAPFIARYRKERIGNLSEPLIREIQARIKRLRDHAERRQTILKAIESQGRLTDELAAAIRGADTPRRLEDLYLPYKPKKKSRGLDARELGLEPLALRIWNRDETLVDLPAAAAELVNPEEGLAAADAVLDGLRHILAESISELAHVREAVRRVVWRAGRIVTSKREGLPEGKGNDFREYFSHAEPIGHIPPHRVMAVNRGEKEHILQVKVDVPRAEVERTILGQLPLEDHPHRDFFQASAIAALDFYLLPSLEREAKRELTDIAERHALDVFARNLRSLLLQPPLTGKCVLAIDPGRKGCRVAVLDAVGGLADQCVIYPFPPQNRRHEAKQTLKDLVGKHAVDIVAIGNGTACRETEELIAEIIAEGTHFQEHPDTAYPASSSAKGEATPAPQAEGSETASEPGTERPAPSEPVTPVDHQADRSDAVSATGAGEAPGEESSSAQAAAAAEIPASEPDAVGPIANASSDEASEARAALEDLGVPPVSGGTWDSDDAPPPPASAPGGDADSAPKSLPQPPVLEMLPAAPEVEMVAFQPGDSPEAISVATTAISEPSPDDSVATVQAATSDAAGEFVAPPPTGPALTPLTQPPRGSNKPRAERPRKPKPKSTPTPAPPPAPHSADPQLAKLAYIIVNESGASAYSASTLAREELPDIDADLRGTISIGRRLQDPLAELVKVEPDSIGVGQYQHDVNPKHLKETLDQVVESCVNFVGVDLNAGNATLLSRVSGLNEVLARRIVEFRKEKGALRSREQLRDVEGITPEVFAQAAGFLRVREGDNPLDRTRIHPDHYALAAKLLERASATPDTITRSEELAALRERIATLDIPATAKELETPEVLVWDTLESLKALDQDPREEFPRPIFKRGLLRIEDLEAGMELKGTILNVVDFGAFVDIGLKDSGLVHISQLANRYVKSPHDVVSVGDVVSVWIMSVDRDRKRVSLTMIRPGTERPRTERADRGLRRGGAKGDAGPARARDDRRGPRPSQRREPGPGTASPQTAGGPSTGGTSEGRPAQPAQPRPGTNRIPGPPLRMQQGRGRGGFGRGGQGGAQGRTGSAAKGQGQGSGRPETDSAGEKAPKPKPAASKSPAPLSPSAISGNAPLRSFEQLKQFFDIRAKPEEEAAASQPASPDTAPETQEPPVEASHASTEAPPAAEGPQESTGV